MYLNVVKQWQGLGHEKVIESMSQREQQSEDTHTMAMKIL